LPNRCQFGGFFLSFLLLHLAETVALDFAFFDDTIFFCFDELLDDPPLLLQFDTMLEILCEATLLDNSFRSFAKEKMLINLA